MSHRVQTRLRTPSKQQYWQHSPQDPEARHVGLNATRLQGCGTLKNEWKTVHQAYRQSGIADGNDTTPMEVDALMKSKGKNKGTSKGKERRNIRQSNVKSVHVCPPDHGQEHGLRKSSKTRPLLTASGAEMKQHGMRQVSCDTEFGKTTTDYRVLDVRRPILSLGSMMDSGCDVHFTNAVGYPKTTGKNLT